MIKWTKLLLIFRWWSHGVFSIPRTEGFANHVLRLSHYGRHGSDLGCAAVMEYEAMADFFLGCPKPSTAVDCYRRHGDLVRFDTVTNELGVLSKDQVIRTYFKPTMYSRATPAQIAQGKYHKRATHLDYWQELCNQQ